MKIYNFGSINIDEIYQVKNIVRPGETISSIGFHNALGGKGLNQSIAIARSGSEVAHIGFVGKQDLRIKEFLKKENIDVKNIVTGDFETGKAIIQLSEDGENSIVINSGANYKFSGKMIDDVFSGITEQSMVLVQNETNEVNYVLTTAKAKGHITALNMAPINEFTKDIDLANVDYLIVNEIEGEALTKKTTSHEILDKLINDYPNIKVVLTLGSDGVLYKDKSNDYNVKAWKTNVVDTTGAGDTFVGYFLSCLPKYGIEKSLQLANTASSIAIGILGASNSIPHLKAVESKLYDK